VTRSRRKARRRAKRTPAPTRIRGRSRRSSSCQTGCGETTKCGDGQRASGAGRREGGRTRSAAVAARGENGSSAHHGCSVWVCVWRGEEREKKTCGVKRRERETARRSPLVLARPAPHLRADDSSDSKRQSERSARRQVSLFISASRPGNPLDRQPRAARSDGKRFSGLGAPLTVASRSGCRPHVR